MRLTPAQLTALDMLAGEYKADDAHVDPADHGSVEAQLWCDGEGVPRWTGSVSVAGTIRTASAVHAF